MLKKIDHLGIAVNDLDKSVNILKAAFNLEVGGIEEVSSQQVNDPTYFKVEGGFQYIH
ncbi:MAG TPA: hypothetical protein GX529_08320 [Firmicutes bacterium]|nr:hypothetical protein [Candidatus Fermentithermobacillaceae bacterium]